MSGTELSAKDRVEIELFDLQERTTKLNYFIDSDNFQNLSKFQQELLIEQRFVMRAYIAILEDRLAKW